MKELNSRVVYQIYPKSFKDTNGDGVGDLPGVIEKLDYLAFLGVDMIWLTPFYVSPQRDNGYDIADYYRVDPMFGSDADVDALIQKASERGIDIMLDMVFNHTSTEHAWFQEALNGKKDYQDYYFFEKKPTNWKSKFGGNAWTYVEDLQLYYLHLFDKTQADLNWENPAVFKELCDIVQFWLRKGIKGFRFDVINLVSKPDHFEDDDIGDGRRFYTDGPRIHEHLNKLNRATFGQIEGVVTVGELSSTSIDNGVKYADPSRNELSTIFNFHHLKVDYQDGDKWQLMPFDFFQLKTILREWQEAMQESNAISALFWCNHDQPRVISRFGSDEQYPKQSAKMLATAMQLMRGMPYIYQGEEIGLPNAYFTNIHDYQDVESINLYHEMTQTQSQESVIKILQERSRDNGRTPIPWSKNASYYGFSDNAPWLPLTKAPSFQTVDEALADEDSIFYHYKKLIELRKANPVIADGTIVFEQLEHPSVFAYKRILGSKVIYVVCNFYEEKTVFHLPSSYGKLLLSNYEDTIIADIMALRPYESVVVEFEV